MVSALVRQRHANVAAAQDFWSRNQTGQGYPLLPDELRDALIQNAETVLIERVRQGNTKIGAAWFVDIDAAGSKYTTIQGCNEVRDRLMTAIKEYTETEGPLPACLEPFVTSKGEGWNFGTPLPDATRGGQDATTDDGDAPY